MRITSNELFADIPSIRAADGLITTVPKKINKAFCDFYTTLYQSDRQLDEIRCADCLKQLDLPSLSVEDSLRLDSPITLRELEEAALSMQFNKSPSLDGIPPEFYLLFWE